ncbi:MAG: hypothetical protein SOT71_14260 [Romboutsia timonensis]|uniref:hypothetical protein n=1 Tax=Romboutsia timonensis TaxID=1776391 RepID=UPI002A75926D|nr:hypothetical protein [Romboutsia timonensis]MDY2883807.1 hypothetical protein [Romboutsia timonensis]
MKIENSEIIILSVTEKAKQDGTPYVYIGFASLSDGTPFNVSSTDMELLNLEPFSKHLASFTLSDSKYGMRLNVDSIE